MKARRIKERNVMRGLLVLLVCFLTMYASIELSRVIVNWGLTAEFISELILMWIFYGLAIFIISVIVLRRVKEKSGNSDNKERMIE